VLISIKALGSLGAFQRDPSVGPLDLLAQDLLALGNPLALGPIGLGPIGPWGPLALGAHWPLGPSGSWGLGPWARIIYVCTMFT